MHLSWIDYAILIVYVGATIVAGTLARGAIKGISDFSSLAVGSKHIWPSPPWFRQASA